MSELRRAVDEKIQTIDQPFTVHDLWPHGDNPTRKKTGMYLYELVKKGLLRSGPKTGVLRTYMRPSQTPCVEPPAETPSESISEHKIGEAIYDLITKLQNDQAKLKRELDTVKTQARLKAAEFARQLGIKEDRIAELLDEIELLERKSQRVIRVPREMSRTALFDKL